MKDGEESLAKSCCPPKEARKSEPLVAPSDQKAKISFNVCEIPGGSALMGTGRAYIPLDEESPCRTQEIQPFKIMKTAVTNAMFRAFIQDTAYITEAQRFGWSFVFYHQLPEHQKETESPSGTHWWRKVEGAAWNRIAGPGSELQAPDNHPVVHVSWNDAKAFAKWAGGRLPSEAEWEHAARGGLGDVMFPWGNQEPDDNNFQPCNIWQGAFPTQNAALDGYPATAPAESFSPNHYGLYNVCGNVWEWTSGRFKLSGRSAEAKRHSKQFKGTKVLKGGSYLCHKSYCFRYRIAARTGNTPDSTTTHQGFRLVFD